jgi:hypothetical protein
MLAVVPIVAACATMLRSQLAVDFQDPAGRSSIGTVLDIHRKMRAYAVRAKAAAGCDRRIFSLAGAFAVDTGFPLSRYMEGGVFWSWVRDQVPRTYIADKSYRLDEYTLYPERWVRDQAINFVLVGYYPGAAESAIEAYAVERGFKAEIFPLWQGATLKFYYNPGCSD